MGNAKRKSFAVERLRAALLAIIAVAAGSWTVGATAQEKLTILSGYDLMFMQGYIADKKGYFTEEGLDVTVKYSVSGKVAVDGVVADAGVMGISGALVSVTAAIQAPIYVVAPLGRSEHLMEMVTLAGINSASDLKGKRIAFQFGTEGHRFVLLYLQQNGLTADDVTLMNIPAQALPPALSRGDVDAVAVWPPHSTKAVEATSGAKVLTNSQGVSAAYGVVIMRKDFVESNPEGGRKLLRGLLRADTFIKANPERTLEYFAEQGTLDMATARKINASAKPQYGMALDKAFFDENQSSADFLADHGFTKSRADANDFIYEELMQSVSSDLVSF